MRFCEVREQMKLPFPRKGSRKVHCIGVHRGERIFCSMALLLEVKYEREMIVIISRVWGASLSERET